MHDPLPTPPVIPTPCRRLVIAVERGIVQSVYADGHPANWPRLDIIVADCDRDNVGDEPPRCALEPLQYLDTAPADLLAALDE